MKVKITQCSGAGYWYKKHIGETFDVDAKDSNNYKLKDNNAYWIGVEDCEVVDKQQPAPRKFAVGDKVRIVKKAVNEDFYWSRSMDATIGTTCEINTNTFEDHGTYVLDNGWAYLPESLELVVEDKPSFTYEVEPTKAMPTIDSHYNFNYLLTQWDRDMGSIKLDPYFVAKQWDLGSKDPSGVIWHIVKTCARFGEKNDKAREINAIYKSIKRLAELEGVTLD